MDFLFGIAPTVIGWFVLGAFAVFAGYSIWQFSQDTAKECTTGVNPIDYKTSFWRCGLPCTYLTGFVVYFLAYAFLHLLIELPDSGEPSQIALFLRHSLWVPGLAGIGAAIAFVQHYFPENPQVDNNFVGFFRNEWSGINCKRAFSAGRHFLGPLFETASGPQQYLSPLALVDLEVEIKDAESLDNIPVIMKVKVIYKVSVENAYQFLFSTSQKTALERFKIAAISALRAEIVALEFEQLKGYSGQKIYNLTNVANPPYRWPIFGSALDGPQDPFYLTVSDVNIVNIDAVEPYKNAFAQVGVEHADQKREGIAKESLNRVVQFITGDPNKTLGVYLNEGGADAETVAARMKAVVATQLMLSNASAKDIADLLKPPSVAFGQRGGRGGHNNP